MGNSMSGSFKTEIRLRYPSKSQNENCCPIPAPLDDAYQSVYDRIKSDSFKKTDFAMDILACPEEWIVPGYIAEGLKWLEERLSPQPTPVAETEKVIAQGA